MSNANKFSRNNQPFTCEDCGKRTTNHAADDMNGKLCQACYDDAGLENDHNDNHTGSPDAACRFCTGSARAIAPVATRRAAAPIAAPVAPVAAPAIVCRRPAGWPEVAVYKCKCGCNAIAAAR